MNEQLNNMSINELKTLITQIERIIAEKSPVGQWGDVKLLSIDSTEFNHDPHYGEFQFSSLFTWKIDRSIYKIEVIAQGNRGLMGTFVTSVESGWTADVPKKEICIRTLVEDWGFSLGSIDLSDYKIQNKLWLSVDSKKFQG